jgi:hypothetical protein
MIALAIGACDDGDAPPDTSRPKAPDRVEGVVTDVTSENIDDVTAFEVRSEGQTYEIFIDPEIDYGFRLGHLQAHVVGSDPVIVELEERDGKLFALSIEDA